MPEFQDGKVRNLMLADTARLTATWRPDLLKGVEVIQGRAVSLKEDGKGGVQKAEQEFTAIPYYAWANRGRGQMMVWIPNSEASAKPLAYPTLATTATITVSGKSRKNPRNINDGEDPASWRLLYKDGDEWKPVEAAGPYGVERNQYNRVAFTRKNERAAPGVTGAAQCIDRGAGVEGEVGLLYWACSMRIWPREAAS